jgi:hypothetical protein
MKPESLREKDAVLLIDIMRRKASELNTLFGTDKWTPRKLDMILWAWRKYEAERLARKGQPQPKKREWGRIDKSKPKRGREIVMSVPAPSKVWGRRS